MRWWACLYYASLGKRGLMLMTASDGMRINYESRASISRLAAMMVPALIHYYKYG